MNAVDVATRPAIALREYQREALDAVAAAHARGVTRQLLVLPTGTGKTIIFSELVRRRRADGRALILVHRDELVRQAVEKLEMVAPLGVGVVKAERDDVGAPVIVASVQTLARETRLRRLPPDFATVIVDEAHHVAADSYQRVLERMRVGAEDGPLALGVTATPERADGQPLDGWEIVYQRTLPQMIRAGYLADLRAVQVRLAVDFRPLHTRAGDFIETDLEAMLLDASAPKHAVRAYTEHAAGRKALVFTPTVRVANEMAMAFAAAGIAAEALHGGTPLDVRRDLLARFRRGDTRVVTNCAVLTEGFDEPTVAAVIVARPTRSRLLYVQMLGRGTRLHPGKADCLVLDLVGATDRHDLMTAAKVLNVRPATLAAGGALAGLVEREREEQTRAAGLDGPLTARVVDLFRPVTALPRQGLNWVAGAGGRYALATGDGTLVLCPVVSDEAERWDVRLRRRTGTLVLAQALPLEYAQGVAEDYARRVGANALIDPQARWRAAPATERQLAALRRLRIPVADGLTKGQAADLLTRAFAG